VGQGGLTVMHAHALTPMANPAGIAVRVIVRATKASPEEGNSTMVSAGAVNTRSVTSRAGCTLLLPPSPNSAVMLLLPLPLLLLLRVGLPMGLLLVLAMLLSCGCTQSYARTCSVPYSSLHDTSGTHLSITVCFESYNAVHSNTLSYIEPQQDTMSATTHDRHETRGGPWPFRPCTSTNPHSCRL
jgi:hypothetical protein